ncbi:MAG: trypsin-like serine protease [Pseudomonadota bacterium]
MTRRPGFRLARARRGRALCGALLCLGLSALSAQAEGRRYTTDEEAARWAGVGLVMQTGGGRCTGALIRPDVVLTAAHCVADADQAKVSPASEIYFDAGVRNGARVDRVQARRIEVHPGYFVASDRYDARRVRVDLAKVHLDRPVVGAPTYRVGTTPTVGEDLVLTSYSSGRFSRLSIQDRCPIAGRETEFLLLGCLSEPGASGSPYFKIGINGEPAIVGVNSGRRLRGDRPLALALAFSHVRDFIGVSEGAPGGAAAPSGADASSAVSEGGGRKASTPKSGVGGRLPGGSTPGDRIKRVTP